MIHITGLVSLIFTVIVLGVICYLINAIAPLPSWAKIIINALCAIFALWIVLSAFGLLGGGPIFVR